MKLKYFCFGECDNVCFEVENGLSLLEEKCKLIETKKNEVGFHEFLTWCSKIKKLQGLEFVELFKKLQPNVKQDLWLRWRNEVLYQM